MWGKSISQDFKRKEGITVNIRQGQSVFELCEGPPCVDTLDRKDSFSPRHDKACRLASTVQ